MIYLLLLGNVALYARHGRVTEVLDAASWVTLLALFELETGGWNVRTPWLPWMHRLRLIASVGVAAACVGYAIERQWLDFANEITWLAVVVLLELEVRMPAGFLRAHQLRRLAALACYTMLVGLLVWWLVDALRGPAAARFHGLLDAWDALLWLASFWVVELNVLRRVRAATASQVDACARRSSSKSMACN